MKNPLENQVRLNSSRPLSGIREIILIVLLALLTPAAWSSSYLKTRLNDPRAVYIAGPTGDDDTALLQQAINKVQETTGQGIVLIAPGHYRVSDTIHIWPGIRLIGYGESRPVVALPASSAGFSDATHERIIFFFAGGRPGADRRPRNGNSGTQGIPDANPGTFYSALMNLDIEIEAGNPGTVAVRSHYAQHCFLAHMEMRLGPALAGVHEAGNVIEDVRFVGGRHGIWTSKPSPSWQLAVIDSAFEGQAEAAILEHEAGLTLVRPYFHKVPIAVEVEPGWADELWIKDGRFDEISGSALAFGVENNPRNEINVEGASCRNVPTFATLRESGKRFTALAESYNVKAFCHGLTYSDLGATPKIENTFKAAATSTLAPVKSDIPTLPPCENWADIRDLGAKGDGVTDDTEAIQKAIASHQTLYFPSGFYIVRDTLTLRPDTVLIGLHPGATQIILPDGTPAYQGIGTPKPLLESPRGGSNVVVGIGLYTSGNNPRAVAALWKAGANSMMNDVRFLGGHGTPKPDGSRENPYNPNHSADPDPVRRWDSQYPSLWVTDGGGGTFLDIWTPSTFAQAGMRISDTDTEGRIYEMSSEHHVRNEIQIRNAAHWRIYALQTEEERGESGFALPLEIEGCHDILLANFHIYRVISMFQPFPQAVKISNSTDIRFRNFHCYSNSKVSFDSAIFDQDHGIELRQREFAWLNFSGKRPQPQKPVAGPMFARGAKVKKLAGGFFNISGGATAPNGDFYFIDSRWDRIHRWDAANHSLRTVCDVPLSPVNLAADQSGNLIVVSSAGKGTVYTVRTNGAVEVLSSRPLTGAAQKCFYLPTSDWRINQQSLSNPAALFVSPDNSTALPVAQDFLNGATSWGVKSSPQIRAFGLARAVPGKPFYVSDEAQLTTYAADVATDGSLNNFRLFVEQGGEGVTADAQGNVYVVAGQVYIYDSKGRSIGKIELPERPLQVAFGGPDKRTLFIPARTSLYSVQTRAPGE